MNRAVLQIEIQEFINRNLDTNLNALILKGSPFKSVTTQQIARQIEGKKKAKDKLPSWFAARNIYYPQKINLEQCSSEQTAKYKTGLVSGKKLLDLTGGFGVDTVAFAKKFHHVTYCDTNKELTKITQYNATQLGIQNIDFHPANGLDFLKEKKQYFDCIFIDPSRRDTNQKRVFLLDDCLPNVPQNLTLLFNYSDNILIKTSPMLDVNIGVNELNFVKEIHIVAVKNEVKEVLYLLEKNYMGRLNFKTVNFTHNGSHYFDFNLSLKEPDYSLPLTYLYEPNAAILKSGGFLEVGIAFNVKKLHKHSHLYTSNNLIDFPGRRFINIKKIGTGTKNILRNLPDSKANITTRNFPEKVSQIRKRTKIKEGGDYYIFFTTDINEDKIALICKKV
ncbi:MAG: SAM-dependent methyltransferase [Flavobacteriales bacterium]|nr:MAG: SAM-dependent methyltransferase [Flavobacteriales bacterium]